jgi:hypothetical protein
VTPVGVGDAARLGPRREDEWIWDVLADLEAAGLVILAGKGYQHLREDPAQGEEQAGIQKQANQAHAKLQTPDERANAQLKTWRLLRKLRCRPWNAGQLARPSTHCRSTRQRRMKGSLKATAMQAR